MKLALIVASLSGGVPIENTPTVLAVFSLGDVPSIIAAFAGISDVQGVSSGTPDVGVGPLQIGLKTVRVEDTVAVGDTLDASGDVFHKHV